MKKIAATAARFRPSASDLALAADLGIVDASSIVGVGRYLRPVVLDLHDGDINTVPEHDEYVARVLSGAHGLPIVRNSSSCKGVRLIHRTVGRQYVLLC
jgi:hypothetical protein